MIKATNSYIDYKRFENILTDVSFGIKDFIDPINFFLPSEDKIGYLDKDQFIKSLFSSRIVRLPFFNIIDEKIEKFNRFEDYTKKDEVNNIALWILSAFRYLSSRDLRLGRELEITQQGNPRDGRLDVVAMRDKDVIVVETKTDLRALLSENRFVYQIAGYTKECKEFSLKHLNSTAVDVLLGIGGEETDLFPFDHPDCTTGIVGNISKIFYDKIIENNIRFVSANAIWSILSYKYLEDKNVDLFDFLKKVFSRKEVVGLLSAGMVINTKGVLSIERIQLDSF